MILNLFNMTFEQHQSEGMIIELLYTDALQTERVFL